MISQMSEAIQRLEATRASRVIQKQWKEERSDARSAIVLREHME
jgi:hypothetical protein